MRLFGLQKLTLLDYPERIACTVFTGGCNLRCPFCHNGSLALGDSKDEISEEEFFSFLESRVGRLDGVCISGGEPTLQPDLADFARKIKALGFSVKLDTNGTRPEVISSLIREGLLDYIAMDIKNSPAKYAETAGVKALDYSPISESIKIISESGVAHEFRTTVTAELHDAEDIREICKNLHRDAKYYLQSYRDEGEILKKGLSTPTEEQISALLLAAREFLPYAEKR